MSLYSFSIEKKATNDGVVEASELLVLPVKAKLVNLEIKTTSNCLNRIHYTSLLMKRGSNVIIDLPREEVQDCSVYILPNNNLELSSGQYRVVLKSSGFNACEVVKLSGKIVYILDIFFGEIDGLSEEGYLI